MINLPSFFLLTSFDVFFALRILAFLCMGWDGMGWNGMGVLGAVICDYDYPPVLLGN
jgi:hypothetical protein